jgi:hypothetical protein
MQGPLPGRAAAAGGPGAARPHALRPRPGEPRLGTLAGRPGPLVGHEEHGSPPGLLLFKTLFPIGMADDALYRAVVDRRDLAETNVRRPFAVAVCCCVR